MSSYFGKNKKSHKIKISNRLDTSEKGIRLVLQGLLGTRDLFQRRQLFHGWRAWFCSMGDSSTLHFVYFICIIITLYNETIMP